MLCTLLLSAVTSTTPRPCSLEENLREADVIVAGRIEKILVARENADAPGFSSGGSYLLRVERCDRGAPGAGDLLRVEGCGNWTCEARQMEYAPGQQLLLFLEARENGLAPYCGFQSERVVTDGRLRQPHLPNGPEWNAARFLDGLPDLLRFVEMSPRTSSDVTAWQALLVHPNLSVRRFGLQRIDDYDLYHLFDTPEPDAIEFFKDLPRAARVSLLPGVLANLGREERDLRADARAAARELLRSFGDQPLQWDAVRTFTEAAIAQLHAVEARGVEGETLPCQRLRAALGDVWAVPPLLESLAEEGHRQCSKSLRALEDLNRLTPLARRDVLDTLAAHGDDDACAYDLGRLAVALVTSEHTSQRLDVSGVPRRQWGARFRDWWPAHREWFPSR